MGGGGGGGDDMVAAARPMDAVFDPRRGLGDEWRELRAAIGEAKWNLVCSKAWQREASLPELEARALLTGLRHLLRN